jgi:hypothetical protein
MAMPLPADRTGRARRSFFVLAALLVAFKLALSAVLPFTGDEAYFYYWGVDPHLGFYDHPPMIGWWLAALLPVSDAAWWLRLPVTLLPLPLAAVAYWLARDAGRERAHAWLAALVVLLAPTHVWAVFITTDTPLILFSFLSAAAYVVAVRRESVLWHALAGLLLSAALLSKYFAVFLGIAFFAHTLLARRDAMRWGGFAALVLCALPGPLLNVLWNAGHCWPNLMFNLFNRHDAAGLSWRTPLLYAAGLVYVLSPFALIAAFRHWPALAAAMRSRDEAGTLFWLSLLPFALFAALSPVKVIGLHWLLSFVPIFLVALALVLGEPALRRLVRWLAGFALLHVVVLTVVVALPIETWARWKSYPGLVLTLRAPELLQRVAPYAADHALASDGYSNAVTLGYNARRYFFVFGPGSSHARHDDLMHDLRPLAGKNILVLRKSAPREGEYERYFAAVEVERFVVAGAPFWMIRGREFDYARYRDEVLAPIRDAWYRVPGWLPMTRPCFYCERYFPGTTCPVR